MASPTDHEVTRLLEALSAGNEQALHDLLPLVYGEMRRQAARYLRRERADHTLQPTALVHEAYMRLVDQRQVRWQNRAHFFGIAAQAMRRILVDHARARERVKRGGPQQKISLTSANLAAEERSVDLIALDEALERLAKLDERQSKVVELRFFGGLTVEETAEVLDISPATVKREWTMAKAWLHAELQPGPSGPLR
jgi:RNA polymerase sigma-70 factor (ECF subfamily)